MLGLGFNVDTGASNRATSGFPNVVLLFSSLLNTDIEFIKLRFTRQTSLLKHKLVVLLVVIPQMRSYHCLFMASFFRGNVLERDDLNVIHHKGCESNPVSCQRFFLALDQLGSTSINPAITRRPEEVFDEQPAPH